MQNVPSCPGRAYGTTEKSIRTRLARAATLGFGLFCEPGRALARAVSPYLWATLAMHARWHAGARRASADNPTRQGPSQPLDDKGQLLHTVEIWYLVDLTDDTCPSIQLHQLRAPPEAGCSLNGRSSLRRAKINTRTRFERRDGEVATVCIGGTLSPRGRPKARKHGHERRATEGEGKEVGICRLPAELLRLHSLASPHAPHDPFTPLHTSTIAPRICSRTISPFR